MSVVRLSGAGAAGLVRKLCGFEVEAGIPRFARLRLEGEDLDEAIVCRRADDAFELHLHGSPVLVERLARALPVAAAPRTLRKRSLEARARALLEQAPAEAAARILLDQAEGALSRELRSLAGATPRHRTQAIDALLARARTARFALHPAEVVLAGPVNAGKSTLFNALLGEARAIVDATPGTTRDLLRERALFGAWPVRIVDIAGEREPGSEPDDVEREGRTRGRRARTDADLVLWLVPIAGADTTPPARAVLVRTFADRSTGEAGDAISALRDPAGARARIAEIFRRTFDVPEDPWIAGAAVPFTEAIAAAIADLRGVEGAEFSRRAEAIAAGELPDVFAPHGEPA